MAAECCVNDGRVATSSGGYIHVPYPAMTLNNQNSKIPYNSTACRIGSTVVNSNFQNYNVIDFDASSNFGYTGFIQAFSFNSNLLVSSNCFLDALECASSGCNVNFFNDKIGPFKYPTTQPYQIDYIFQYKCNNALCYVTPPNMLGKSAKWSLTIKNITGQPPTIDVMVDPNNRFKSKTEFLGYVDCPTN